MTILAVLLLAALPASAAPEMDPGHWIGDAVEVVSEWIGDAWASVWESSESSTETGPGGDPFGEMGPVGDPFGGKGDAGESATAGPVIDPHGPPSGEIGPTGDPHGSTLWGTNDDTLVSGPVIDPHG